MNANILFAFLEISHTILPHKCVTRALSLLVLHIGLEQGFMLQSTSIDLDDEISLG